MNERPTLTEIHTADIHFGAFNPKDQYDILYREFYLKIAPIPYDIISINGDLFDHKFMANSDAVYYAMEFVNLLCTDAVNKGAVLIILSGTESHDAGQIVLFDHLRDLYPNNIMLIDQLTAVYVKGKKLLAIPELYGVPAEVYDSFLYHNGLYDGVIMHGTYKGSVYGANSPTLESTHAPIFGPEHFIYCRGPIIAGHVHVAGCYDGHMYYCGSPLRYRFGEEEDKGFIILTHNLNTCQYYLHFEPIVSYRYDTINVDEYAGRDPAELIEYVNSLKANGIHHLRLEFTVSDEKLFNVIDTYFRNVSNVVIHKPDIQKEEMIRAQVEQSNKYDEYQYLFDRSMSPEQILTRYINQQKGYQYITTDELQNVLKGFDI